MHHHIFPCLFSFYIYIIYIQIVCDQHGPPGKTRRPLPPSFSGHQRHFQVQIYVFQKYLENAKKVKKTTKSAIFLVIYYNKVLQIFMKIADFVVFFTFFTISRYFWWGGGRGERASCFSKWSMLIANYLYQQCQSPIYYFIFI